MSRGEKIFSNFLPVVLITALTAGCATRCPYSEAPSGKVFLSPNPNFEETSFSKWIGHGEQNDRIRYLLERLGDSNDRFIRNGRAHNGKKARIWLLYKMGHWVEDVSTAEDFVSRVATYSQKTGKPYLVEDLNGQVYSLGSVLKNELTAFDNHQNKFRVSKLSLTGTTAVASAAVAATTSS